MRRGISSGESIDVLTAMVEPGWKVLDIGAGSGVSLK